MADPGMDDPDRAAARSFDARPAERSQPERRIWPWALAGLLFCFALGMIASPWFERQVRGSIPGALAAELEAGGDPRVADLAARVARLESDRPSTAEALPVAGPATASLAGRVAAVEAQSNALRSTDGNLQARIEELSAELARTSSAAQAGAARMRDLFLLTVARRMLEAGRPLTPLEAGIEQRFRPRDAAAVDALVAWSRVPQTRRTLASRLDAMEVRAKAGPGTAAGWWDRLKAGLAGLVTVKGAEPQGTHDPQLLLADARAALGAGDLAFAAGRLDPLAEPEIRQWAADARALAAAEDGLQRLESLAIETALSDSAASAAGGAPPPVNAPAASVPAAR